MNKSMEYKDKILNCSLVFVVIAVVQKVNVLLLHAADHDK